MLYKTANDTTEPTAVFALPIVHMNLAFKGQHTAKYLSMVTAIVKYADPVWAIIAIGYIKAAAYG